jgi:hypothetical protein
MRSPPSLPTTAETPHLRAEYNGRRDNSDRRIFIWGFNVAIEVVDIHLHLAKVLVGELVEFEVDENVAMQEAIVENKINIEPI